MKNFSHFGGMMSDQKFGIYEVKELLVLPFAVVFVDFVLHLLSLSVFAFRKPVLFSQFVGRLVTSNFCKGK